MNTTTRIAIASIAVAVAQFGGPRASALDYKSNSANQCVPAHTSTAADVKHFPGSVVNVTQQDQWVMCGIQTDSDSLPTEDNLWTIYVGVFNTGTQTRQVSCVVYVGSVGLSGALTQAKLVSVRGNDGGDFAFTDLKRPEAHFLQPVSVNCRLPPNTRIFRIASQELTPTTS